MASTTKSTTVNPTEPQRYVELRREPHLFMKRLSEAEKSQHQRQMQDCDGHIGQLSAKQKEVKEFINTELFGGDPIRMRARAQELKRRNALLAVEKKRYELTREEHLNAAADGYTWITVECVLTADDVEREMSLTRTDTGEVMWKRPMDEGELQTRKKRLQLDLKGTNARGGKA